MKRITLLIALMLGLVCLTGCETIKGIAQDIENTGNNIWDAVNKE